jgi:hypothetical protein
MRVAFPPEPVTLRPNWVKSGGKTSKDSLMSDEDLRAMWKYVKSLGPAQGERRDQQGVARVSGGWGEPSGEERV